MPLVIDGYNLLKSIHKWSTPNAKGCVWGPQLGDDADSLGGAPQTRKRAFGDPGEVGLCKILSAYLHRIRDNGQIIFDGIGPPDKTGFESTGPLEVIFSGRDRDADTVIENKIIANTAPKRLTVVSSDRRIRIAAKKRKAIAVKSEDFWRNVIKCLNKKKRSSPEPKEKRIGISETETDLWLKTFGLDDQ